MRTGEFVVNLSTARRRVLPSRIVDSDYFPFEGGLNLVDTPLKIRPGQLLAGKNYEPGIRGGYRSVPGYERMDGRTLPSQAQYWLLDYEWASSLAPIGSQLRGLTSGATGTVLGVEVVQPITTVNLLLQSDAINAAPWTTSQATIQANAVVDPLTGNQSVDLLLETVTNAQHVLAQQITTIPGQVYWASCYCRAQGRTQGRLHVFSLGGSSNGVSVTFDLLNRAIANANPAGTYSALGQWMEDIGDGFFRIGLKFVSPDTQALLRLQPSLNGATAYAGDVTRGLATFSWQLETTTADSPRPSPYTLSTDIPRGNGRGYYVLARVNGTFASGETLQAASINVAISDGTAEPDNATSDELDQAYSQLAIADMRQQVLQVPGSGRILGTAVYGGVVFAWRNNTAGTQAIMYRASNAGWVPVSLGSKLGFTAGQAAGLLEGDTVTGATSGANAVVRRIVVKTGAFTSNDAAGFLVFAAITGTFANGEALQVNGTTRVTVAGIATAQTLQPDGQYEFRVFNFFGHTSQLRLYGVDGVNKAFEYQRDPEFFMQIDTGMTLDRPNHIGVHLSQLFLSFQGGSVQKSGVGDPAAWTVQLGAGEIGIGDECTGFLEEISDTLFIFARNSTHYLIGKEGTYELKPYNREVGAFPRSIQRIGKGMYLDDRGFSTLGATQSYGNFAYNSISALIQPLVKQLKLKTTASVTVKDDSLYRLFFDNGQFISIGIQDKKLSGFTTCEYAHIVRCAFAGEDSVGEQMIVFGSDDGFVYRAESGTSFDGLPIETFIRPSFHFSRTPSRRKRYRRAQFDVRVTGDLALSIAVDYSFGDADDPVEPVREIQLGGGGGLWGQAIWGLFKWGAGQAPECIVKLEGAGINIGFLIASNSTTATPHSIEGVTLHHSQRRINRGNSYA